MDLETNQEYQDLFEKILNRDEKATKEFLKDLKRSIRFVLIKKGGISDDYVKEIVSEAYFINLLPASNPQQSGYPIEL